MTRYDCDLYSDTKTRPSAAMLQAMVEADIGDEQHGEDPTVDRLTARVAAMLGKDAAVFVPSGTMANEIAMLVHCRAGDEILAHRDSHLLNFEAGGAAALAGAMVRPLEGGRGMFDAATVTAALRRVARHLPRSRVVIFEQTTNLGGGAVWPLEQMAEVAEVTRQAGLAVHIDGARLMNACVASGVVPAAYAALADTVYLDFTKGLGAPFGAVLAGDRATIEAAWRWKQRLGGAMRQAGLLAAACLYALDHNIDRLAEDHANARALADGLAALPGVAVREPETNMVFADLAATGMTAVEFDHALWSSGARVSIQGPTLIRAVTHLDVERSKIDRFVETAGRILAGQERPA
ncbi:aminotransferase class I/II-fold pyridoxal phosphate-dependent enzyme [Frigidibacter albus]|uniref:Aminotransferase class I/II-fold pyridoxal phosphate-dependent enzyme n=1 Tax=Frigidibacter albus TaxID=1465486 RepID=A0A6L8VFY8_9RHOB|nr:threonine aldolase family protein [Frigidibacter albus]MZQ89267.1 aminotransferase class I/II-fold pyridoxal phosphate-dependent enzyme [Frigidibacter albus]NBE31173.1 aminotransferase class I/II-fold pyridoxal phosphate-dependent enzyme [Frigidibacter albus]GGH53290.1 threonine aldolase [Frigidibacter albus]